jgi:hypothetical protein
MELFWSRARFDLHLSDAEFYRLTPRQFSRLCERHRQSLVHREMVGGLTTAAAINHGPYPPKDYVPWTAFSPHHSGFESKSEDTLTDSQKQQIHDHNLRAMEMAARLKAEAQANAPCQLMTSQSSELSSTP